MQVALVGHGVPLVDRGLTVGQRELRVAGRGAGRDLRVGPSDGVVHGAPDEYAVRHAGDDRVGAFDDGAGDHALLQLGVPAEVRRHRVMLEEVVGGDGIDAVLAGAAHDVSREAVDVRWGEPGVGQRGVGGVERELAEVLLRASRQGREADAGDRDLALACPGHAAHRHELRQRDLVVEALEADLDAVPMRTSAASIPGRLVVSRSSGCSSSSTRAVT